MFLFIGDYIYIYIYIYTHTCKRWIKLKSQLGIFLFSVIPFFIVPN